MQDNPSPFYDCIAQIARLFRECEVYFGGYVFILRHALTGARPHICGIGDIVALAIVLIRRTFYLLR